MLKEERKGKPEGSQPSPQRIEKKEINASLRESSEMLQEEIELAQKK
jgi:hypothetical protein